MENIKGHSTPSDAAKERQAAQLNRHFLLFSKVCSTFRERAAGREQPCTVIPGPPYTGRKA